MSERIGPGGRVGVLGGGQLGRMLALAAARMGLETHVYAPEAAPPAGAAARVTTGRWDDLDALAAFAEGLDVATFELENIPLAAVDAVAASVPLHPGRAALAAAQDRLLEKAALAAAGVPVVRHAPIDNPEELRRALVEIGVPAILKTRRLGYDGKGQVRIAAPAEAEAAFAAMKGAPAILEGAVAFRREISVIAARGSDGRIAAYDPAENLHEDGILRRSAAPARAAEAVIDRARAIAARILEALDYVGVIGVELFETDEGRLIANEIAPRVHNTGHWTMEACAVDQFSQHLRAICGWPLGDPRRHADAVSLNLLGDQADSWDRYADEPGALHLYGKAEARPGRKMGHFTRLTPRKS